MARPSMAAERREQILDALEVCILNQGVQATSLENIAEQANMKRSILRHYIGNRDEIICALSERWKGKYTQQWQQLLSWLPSKNRLKELIETLFSVHSEQQITDSIIAEGLFSEARRIETIKQHHLAISEEFITHLSNELKRHFAEADEELISNVAYSIYSNYLHSMSLIPLKQFDQIYQLKQAAHLQLKLFN